MKTVGFIDYFLNEWHANEYPAMIRDYNQKHGTDYQFKYAWAEIDVPGGVTTKEWCKNYGVEPCATIEELCEVEGISEKIATNIYKHYHRDEEND